ncbi:hypothetical protein NPIL_268781 [Nephila pilipes]|uniref:Uncharacterized protein n=1 Tax=Nephila pilipes TaxID=299642 RepID=A0A8X6NJ59_NEPPI|nr:hypothetical protein NPIL_268781 [Nephila pilipes]
MRLAFSLICPKAQEENGNHWLTTLLHSAICRFFPATPLVSGPDHPRGKSRRLFANCESSPLKTPRSQESSDGKLLEKLRILERRYMQGVFHPSSYEHEEFSQ